MIRLKIENFWAGFDHTNDYLVNTIKATLGAQVVTTDPDLILYSVFGWRGKNEKPACWNVNVPRICYSGEALSDDKITQVLNNGDYMIYSKRIDHPRYLRLTETEKYGWYGHDPYSLLTAPVSQKSKFCSFVYHSHVRPRENLCNQLMKYKKIDCLGRSLNNCTSNKLANRYDTSGWGTSNIEALKPYKFNLAIENQPLSGYLTEKIWWAFLSRTVNLYWGDPTVYDSFNRGSFLCRDDFASERQFINAIIELDQDDKAYNKMLNTNTIKDDSLIDKNHLIDFLKIIKI